MRELQKKINKSGLLISEHKQGRNIAMTLTHLDSGESFIQVGTNSRALRKALDEELEEYLMQESENE